MSSDAMRIPVRSAPPAERRFVMALGGIALQLLLLVLGAAASGFPKDSVLRSVVPQQPLLVLSVAIIFTHCSLGAIWWVRSDWSPHAKTAATVVALACLWLLLSQVLQTVRHSAVAALAWATCIALQVTLTGLAVTMLELSIGFHRAAARSRFSLQFVFVWITLLAVALGGAGIILERIGSKLGDVANWEYFAQLQAVAVAGAALAIATYTSVCWPRLWRFHGLAGAVVGTICAIVAPALLVVVFDNKIGAPLIDLVWLFGGQSVFLLASFTTFQIAD